MCFPLHSDVLSFVCGVVWVGFVVVWVGTVVVRNRAVVDPIGILSVAVVDCLPVVVVAPLMVLTVVVSGRVEFGCDCFLVRLNQSSFQ